MALIPGQAATYTPEKIQFDPNTDTVEGRVSGIIDKNSALMQSARTAANADMQRRGLLNSSIAVGAGQKAVIDTATPIATQDASNILSVKSQNAGIANAAAQFGATNVQNERQFEIQGEIQKQLAEQQGTIQGRLIEQQGNINSKLQYEQGDITSRLQAEKARADLQRDMAVQTLQGTQAKDLAELDNKYRVLIQTSANAAQVYTQNSEAISTILANENLTPEAKSVAVAKQIEVMNNGLALIGAMGDVDLSHFFSTGTAPAVPANASPPINPKLPYVNPSAPLTKKQRKALAAGTPIR